MSAVDIGGVQLEYEVSGNKSDPVILLIMGLGSQLIDWPEVFHQKLVEKGYYIIRFDNRDAGLSTKFTEDGVPKIAPRVLLSRLGLRLKVPYTLEEMAADAAGLIDALEIEIAHLVGISMGGMIAQIIAAEQGERIKTLTCLCSSSGNRKLSKPRRDVLKKLLAKPKSQDREDWFTYLYEFFKLIGSPDMDDETLKKRIHERVNRSICPDGAARQLAAIINNGSRAQLLQRIEPPTLCIHGSIDPLIPYEAGEDIARNVKNGKFALIKNMGHDLPDCFVEHIVELIDEHAKSG